MPESRTPTRTPTALAACMAAALLLALAAPAAAQTSDWLFAGELLASEPTFNRPYLYLGTCYLSSVGTAVRFDVHEFILDDTVAPADFAASLCQGADFDSVLYLYQRPNGAPGAFYADDPCARLVSTATTTAAPRPRSGARPSRSVTSRWWSPPSPTARPVPTP